MTNRSLRDRVTSSFFQKRNTIEKEKNRSKPLNPMKYMYKVESKVMSIDINFIGLFEYNFKNISRVLLHLLIKKTLIRSSR